MYTLSLTGIGQLEEILRRDSPLRIGSTYTFTFEHGRIFEYRTDGWVRNRMRFFMQNYGDIITARRPLGSNRYIITVIPKIEASLQQWLSAFEHSWRRMGYRAASFIMAETGRVASEPGGIPRIAKGVGETIAEVFKPLLPFLVVVTVGVVGITILTRK